MTINAWWFCYIKNHEITKKQHVMSSHRLWGKRVHSKYMHSRCCVHFFEALLQKLSWNSGMPSHWCIIGVAQNAPQRLQGRAHVVLYIQPYDPRNHPFNFLCKVLLIIDFSICKKKRTLAVSKSKIDRIKQTCRGFC